MLELELLAFVMTTEKRTFLLVLSFVSGVWFYSLLTADIGGRDR